MANSPYDLNKTRGRKDEGLRQSNNTPKQLSGPAEIPPADRKKMARNTNRRKLRNAAKLGTKATVAGSVGLGVVNPLVDAFKDVTDPNIESGFGQNVSRLTEGVGRASLNAGVALFGPGRVAKGLGGLNSLGYAGKFKKGTLVKGGSKPNLRAAAGAVGGATIAPSISDLVFGGENSPSARFQRQREAVKESNILQKALDEGGITEEQLGGNVAATAPVAEKDSDPIARFLNDPDRVRTGFTAVSPAEGLGRTRPRGVDPRIGTKSASGIPFGAGLGYFLDRARERGDQKYGLAKDAAALDARETDLEALKVQNDIGKENRLGQKDVLEGRRLAAESLNTDISKIIPDKEQAAQFTEFFNATNPRVLVDGGLVSKDAVGDAKNVTDLLVNLRQTDPGSAQQLLAELKALYEIQNNPNIAGGIPTQGLSQVSEVKVPSILEELSNPDGLSAGTALKDAIFRNERVYLDNGQSIPVDDIKNSKARPYLNRRLRKLEEDRVIMENQKELEQNLKNVRERQDKGLRG